MNLLLLYHGGMTSNTRRLYRAIAQQHQIDQLTVVVPERVQSERVYAASGWLTARPEDAEDGYRLVPIPLNEPANYALGFDRTRLRSVLRDIDADVIQVLDEPCSEYLLQIIQLATAHALRARIVFYGFENRPLNLGWRKTAVWRLAWRRTAGGAAANSEALTNLRRAGYPGGRPLERVFWGIPTELFVPVHDSSPQDIGIQAERLVGYAGRLTAGKGLIVLSAAMLHLPPEVHCVLIGSGPLRAELELFARVPNLMGRIHFRDVMNAEVLAPTLGSLDALALPSVTMPRWKEQYGRVLAEGMAAGVPVVGSSSGAIPEVIADAGLIVAEGNPLALAEALHTVIFDDSTRRKLIEKGRRRAEEELSIPVMAGRLAALYERILRN